MACSPKRPPHPSEQTPAKSEGSCPGHVIVSTASGKSFSCDGVGRRGPQVAFLLLSSPSELDAGSQVQSKRGPCRRPWSGARSVQPRRKTPACCRPLCHVELPRRRSGTTHRVIISMTRSVNSLQNYYLRRQRILRFRLSGRQQHRDRPPSLAPHVLPSARGRAHRSVRLLDEGRPRQLFGRRLARLRQQEDAAFHLEAGPDVSSQQVPLGPKGTCSENLQALLPGERQHLLVDVAGPVVIRITVVIVLHPVAGNHAGALGRRAEGRTCGASDGGRSRCC